MCQDLYSARCAHITCAERSSCRVALCAASASLAATWCCSCSIKEMVEPGSGSQSATIQIPLHGPGSLPFKSHTPAT